LKAAENGDSLAMFNIGQRFHAGRGVAKDRVQAYKWLSLAAREVPDSAVLRDEVKRELSREQLTDAKRQIDQFGGRSGQPAKPGA
jgi:TPR repeat protein